MFLLLCSPSMVRRPLIFRLFLFVRHDHFKIVLFSHYGAATAGQSSQNGIQHHGDQPTRLTSHKVYGEATAVLTGDALLTAAFETTARAEASSKTIVEITRVLSNCAGALGMVGGQVLDLEGENHILDAEYIHRLQTLKTGALLEAACVIGVLTAQGSTAEQMAARSYAQSVGLAFQTQDDILDAVGEFAKLGKRVGMDQSKNTFVRLYGLERCRGYKREITGVAEEVWHYRYVGKDIAAEIYAQGLCLEEYIENLRTRN